jgi:hypothetical protein
MTFDQLFFTAIQLLFDLKSVSSTAVSYKEISDVSLKLLDLVKQMNEFPEEIQLECLRLNEAKLDEYRKIYQDAKFDEEMFFAKEILSDKKSLTDFAYDRYDKLVKMNLELTYKHISLDREVPKTMLFAGVGPVPLSAILFAKNDPSLTIDVLDRSNEALDLAKEVIKKYGFENRINILEAVPFEKFDRFNDYDIIWSASMLGSTSIEKEDVYKQLASRLEAGKLIFTRTSRKDSMFEMLHVLFPIEKLQRYYKLIEYESNEKPAVNASLVLERTGD